MGQNLNRTPSEHPKSPLKWVLKWVVHFPKMIPLVLTHGHVSKHDSGEAGHFGHGEQKTG